MPGFLSTSDDNAKAIQAEIDEAAVSGQPVIFPPGRFPVSSIALRSRVRLIGYGTTLVKFGGGPTSILLMLTGTAGEPIVGASVEGLGLENSGSGGLLYGIFCQGVKLRDCSATGPNEWPAYRFDNSSNIEIASCSATQGKNTDQTCGMGVVIGESCSGVNIHDCYFENITENAFTNNARDSRFTNNTVINPFDTGINTHGAGCRNILISGNTITGSSGHGIAVGHESCVSFDSDVTITNNHIIDSRGNGISFVSPDNNQPNLRIAVMGNTIRGFSIGGGSFSGILAKHADACLIRDNLISNADKPGGQAGLWLGGVKRSRIAGNLVRDCPNAYEMVVSDCDSSVIHAGK